MPAIFKTCFKDIQSVTLGDPIITLPIHQIESVELTGIELAFLQWRLADRFETQDWNKVTHTLYDENAHLIALNWSTYPYPIENPLKEEFYSEDQFQEYKRQIDAWIAKYND